MKRPVGGQDGSGLPEPLTHKNASGKVYERHDDVVRQIVEVARLDREELHARARLDEETSPDFLKEECLVYLIRHSYRTGDKLLLDRLSEVLLSRCSKAVDSRLSSLDRDSRKEGDNDVIEQLFTRILDLDSDRGDFLQVRFWVVLKRLTIDAYSKQVARLERDVANVPLASFTEYGSGDELAPGGMGRLPSALMTRGAESVAVENAQIREALNRLDEPYRSAFLLRHAGWAIEDQDPGVPTISRQFEKTPRTIRNWLKKADEQLAAWREEQG